MGCKFSTTRNTVQPAVKIRRNKINLGEDGAEGIDNIEFVDRVYDENENYSVEEGEEEMSFNPEVKKFKLVPIDLELVNLSGRKEVSIKPFYKEYEVLKKKWGRDSLEHRYNGLINQGVTCYMNVSLQSLIKLPGLKDYFLNDLHIKEFPKSSKDTITSRIAELFKVYYSNEDIIIKPEKLHEIIMRRSTLFSSDCQEDAHEFLMYLIDRIAEDLNRVQRKKSLRLVRKKTVLHKEQDSGVTLSPEMEEELSANQWGEYLKMNDSIIGDLLLGQFKSTVTCLECDRKSITFESGYNLALEVPATVDECELTDCIDYYMREEKLEWFCSQCKKMSPAKKKTQIFKLPPVLIIMLKRFRFDVEMQGFKKVETLVNLDLDGVCLKDYVCESGFGQDNYEYQPYAFIHHFGTINNGHYTCSIMNHYTGNWTLVDDSFTKEIPPDDQEMLNDNSNYIIFLKRKDFKTVKRQSIKTPNNWPYQKFTLTKTAAILFNKAGSLSDLINNEGKNLSDGNGDMNTMDGTKRLPPTDGKRYKSGKPLGVKVYKKKVFDDDEDDDENNIIIEESNDLSKFHSVSVSRFDSREVSFEESKIKRVKAKNIKLVDVLEDSDVKGAMDTPKNLEKGATKATRDQNSVSIVQNFEQSRLNKGLNEQKQSLMFESIDSIDVHDRKDESSLFN